MRRKTISAKAAWLSLAFVSMLAAQVPPASNPPPAETQKTEETSEPAAASQEAPPESQSRTQLNLLGQTDSKSGESRRNENVQFNLIDNNALKELNVRIGTTATLVQEFSPERNYFGAEYGTPASNLILLAPSLKSAWHGSAQWTHLNSITSARAFFQVGSVLPARENDYGFTVSGPVPRLGSLTIDAGQNKIRGMVNGNILIPLPNERTVLATDPVARRFVQRVIDSYPNQIPNRPDIDARMLNTNSPQTINNDRFLVRLDRRVSSRDQIVLNHSYLSQKVLAFQLVKGQNPDTTTRSNKSVAQWNRAWSARSISTVAFGFERVRSLIVPEDESIRTAAYTSSVLTVLNGQNAVPIDRVQNLFRTSAQSRLTRGRHQITFGAEILRRQLNGEESDAHLGSYNFNDLIVDGVRVPAIEALRRGLPQSYFQSIGQLTRGFRNFDLWFYAGDKWTISSTLTLSFSVGYRPATRPTEVNNLNQLPYYSDWNNLAPQVGLAWRMPRRWGVQRLASGIHYGEIFPVTFQQIRFNAPLNRKVIIQLPNLADPFAGSDLSTLRSVLYDYSPRLVSPYSAQYSYSWELEPAKDWKLQLGYVGSRAVKLLHHWYGNRGLIRPGIPQTLATVDQRRADPRYNEVRTVTNSSQAWFNAARISLNTARWHGLTLDTSYWFSKALDLGGDYTNTSHDTDSFRFRSQGELDVHKDLKGRTRFDQPHSFLIRTSYALPQFKGALKHRAGVWTLSAVGLNKTGTPFDLLTGSDAPGFGNVDGMSGDRPNLVDPSVLGRSIDHPDHSRALLPRSAFAFLQPTDLSGSLGRHVFRRGPVKNLNLSLSGAWSLARERSLSLRIEAINATNSPQFAEPGARLTDSNFGAITNTLNDGRSFRAQLRLSF